MQTVCQSQETNCQWIFDSTNEMYILKDAQERTLARISGKYLYDPSELPIEAQNAVTQQVKDLWNHWSGVKNADIDN